MLLWTFAHNCLLESVSISLGHMPRNGTAEPHRNSNLWRNCQTHPQRPHFLHSYQPVQGFQCPHTSRALLIFRSFCFIIPVLDVKGPLTVVFHTHLPLHSCSMVSNSLQPWTVACQAPPSMEFSRQESWSALPFSTPGDFPDPGIEPESPESPTLAGRFLTTEPSGKPMHLPND